MFNTNRAVVGMSGGHFRRWFVTGKVKGKKMFEKMNV